MAPEAVGHRFRAWRKREGLPPRWRRKASNHYGRERGEGDSNPPCAFPHDQRSRLKSTRSWSSNLRHSYQNPGDALPAIANAHTVEIVITTA